MIEPLKQAITTSRGVLANVTPEQLSGPTPCASWDVAGLINHMVGTHYFFAANVNGVEMGGDPPNFATGDYLLAFDEGTSQCVAAFSAEGALDKMVKMPFGTMPASAVIGLAVTDTLQHAWDLAKATGQSTDLVPELAAGVLAQARKTIPDTFRGPDGKAPFGAIAEAPAGASPADELAAFLGRTV